MNYSDKLLFDILSKVSVIAIVGASSSLHKPSYKLMKYLQEQSYKIIPINPKYAGQKILGEKVFPSLSECTTKIDMIDIFREKDQITDVAKEAVKNSKRLGISVFWMQLGLINDEARIIAQKSGMTVIMNRCPKIEICRLNKE